MDFRQAWPRRKKFDLARPTNGKLRFTDLFQIDIKDQGNNMVKDFNSILASKTVKRDDEEIKLSRKKIGNLTITSGKIIAKDPLISINRQPFTTAIAPGVYAVTLYIAKFPNNDSRVAFAVLEITDKPVVKWQMAVFPGVAIESLKEGEIIGYGVDTGTGCFMDEDALRFIEELDEDDDEELTDKITDILDDKRVPSWSYANVKLRMPHKNNLIAFSTGFGDGIYTSYFGFDETGQVSCLLTDCNII